MCVILSQFPLTYKTAPSVDEECVAGNEFLVSPIVTPLRRRRMGHVSCVIFFVRMKKAQELDDNYAFVQHTHE